MARPPRGDGLRRDDDHGRSAERTHPDREVVDAPGEPDRGDGGPQAEVLELRARRTGPQVPRFGHGSRVPGWDQSADLARDPSPVPDLATTPVPDDLRTEIEAHMGRYPDRRSAAIPSLAAAQRVHGWCSPQAVEQVAAVMQLTPGYLTAVATFYDMLETEPVGRHHVYVCTNISCAINGADELYHRIEAEAGADPELHVKHFECLGACDMAPMVSADGVYVGPVTLDEVPELIAQVRANEAPLPAKQLGARRSTDPHANTSEFPPHPPVAQRAIPGGGYPVRWPASGFAGPDVTTDAGGPPAPFEQPPTGDQDETKTQAD
jgi:NADH-quinone oxidoreductase subunit E